MPDEVLFRNEPHFGKAAVFAVVAVVAHEEIVSHGYDCVVVSAIAIRREHDHMLFGTEPLEGERCARKTVSPGIDAIGLPLHRLSIDDDLVVADNDVVSRQADQTLDE